MILKISPVHYKLYVFTDLDTQRYYYGYNSKEAIDSINLHEHRLSEIININVEFKNHGLINVDNNEKYYVI